MVMPIIAAGISSGIGKSIAGGIVGGALGKMFGGGSNSNWRQRVDQMKYDTWRAKQYPSLMVEGYKQAGLHPTLAAGASPGQGATMSAATPNDISSSVSAGMQAALNAELQRKQIDLIQAQIDNLNADTKGMPGQNTDVAPLQTTQQTFPLSPEEQYVEKKTGYKDELPSDASLFFSPKQMAEARIRYGDEPVEWFMGLPNLARDAMYNAFKKYGKGRTFTEFMHDQFKRNSSVYRAIDRDNSVGSRGRGYLKRSKQYR